MKDHIIMQPDIVTDEYRSSNEQSQEDFRAAMKDTEALLADLDMNLDTEVESAQKLIAALDAADEEAIAIAADAASSGLPVISLDWLTQFRELARNHGPFRPQEAVRIIHSLNDLPDQRGRSMTVPSTDDTTEVETDDDLLSDLDMTLASEVESNAEIMAALDPSDDDILDRPDTDAPVADWLTDVQELARKHGPFAPWQIVQVIRALNATEDPAVEAGR